MYHGVPWSARYRHPQAAFHQTHDAPGGCHRLVLTFSSPDKDAFAAAPITLGFPDPV